MKKPLSQQAICSVPKVSVAMVTYNHAKYIAQAIESVLMQATDFQVELIIGEDCSTDATRQIVQQYSTQYPTVIRTLLSTHNLGAHKNYFSVMSACRGEYIAYLEGDDYWTDTGKLVKQVEMMDMNPSMPFCFHQVIEFDESQGKKGRILPGNDPRDFHDPVRELIRCNFIPSTSRLMRRSMLPLLDSHFENLKLGDWPISIIMALNGKMGFLPEIMGAYRIHSSNIWNGLNYEIQEEAIYDMFIYLYNRWGTQHHLLNRGLISYSRLMLLHRRFKGYWDRMAFAEESLKISHRMGGFHFIVQQAWILFSAIVPRQMMRKIHAAGNIIGHVSNLRINSLKFL